MILRLFEARRPLGRVIRVPLGLIPLGTKLPILGTAARGKKWIAGSGPNSNWLGWNERTKRRVFAAVVKPAAVVYDVGANAGSYTILASVLVGNSGRVIAFEPVPANVEFLRQHVRINGLQNVTIVSAAVDERTGEAKFEPTSDWVLGHLSTAGPMTVETVTLDDYAVRADARLPDVIKVDVEGGELGVLRDAAQLLKRAKPIIFLAVHSAELDKQCQSILAEAGYNVRMIEHHPDELVAVPRELGSEKTENHST
jgi:FkbM family methyltransferase